MTEPRLSPWRFCVAPMMDWTTRECRVFHRQLSRHARLYTEMVTTGALLFGDAGRHLRHEAVEHPLALQLGGSEPEALARCAELGERWGYDEINLNCGCPSDRVQEGRFGACLMREPQRVAESVRAMRRATTLPVTVKHRLGVDHEDDEPFLRRFIDTVAEAGCEVFIVHARKAWLNGLSPRENREIPPLQIERVLRLKQDYPQLTVVVNGGLLDLDRCAELLQTLDGVMLGRAAYENPYLLAAVDQRLFDPAAPVPSRAEVLARLRPFVEQELAAGARLSSLTRHLLGLYRGEPGGRLFRRQLSEGVTRATAGLELYDAAREAVERARLAVAA
ncbi:MAG TPA: tRNA dihydrouridine(20/20a) synthase DusA [Nevskiaceae bacterium]|nr:tRNA dihydrouridine(20/20a) synthase DusA [Nevskiaceae bacterium]